MFRTGMSEGFGVVSTPPPPSRHSRCCAANKYTGQARGLHHVLAEVRQPGRGYLQLVASEPLQQRQRLHVQDPCPDLSRRHDIHR